MREVFHWRKGDQRKRPARRGESSALIYARCSNNNRIEPTDVVMSGVMIDEMCARC